MKKLETKKPLPKLQARTLDHQDLTRVTGGCTCGTTSSCHIDGTTDADQQK